MSLIKNVFADLNAASIGYFHFKSSSHLDKSFDGTTDFDIVVNKKHVNVFEQILRRHGAKRRVSTFNAVFEGVYDYLIFDVETGKLFHFHIHLQLIFGKKETKNFVLGQYEDFIDFVELDKAYKIYRLTYEFELVLLVLRAVSKVKKYDPRIYWRWIKYGSPLGRGLHKEIFWLSERVELESLKETRKVFGDAVVNEVEAYLLDYRVGKVKRLDYFTLSQRLSSLIKYKRRTPFIISHVDGLIRGIHKWFSRRWMIDGGLCVAVIGSDGSGKTTVCKNVIKELNYKLNAKHIYLGLPKSFIFRAITKCSNILAIKGFSRVSEYLDGMLYVFAALTRKKLIAKGIRYSNAGYIVIFERYPLKEFVTMTDPMDGPKIKPGNFLYEKEQKIYNELPDYVDLNLIMKIDLQTVIDRKFSNAEKRTIEVIEKKVSAVNSLKESKSDGILELDASVDKNEVLLAVKRAIYAYL